MRAKFTIDFGRHESTCSKLSNICSVHYLTPSSNAGSTEVSHQRNQSISTAAAPFSHPYTPAEAAAIPLKPLSHHIAPRIAHYTKLDERSPPPLSTAVAVGTSPMSGPGTGIQIAFREAVVHMEAAGMRRALVVVVAVHACFRCASRQL